MRKLIFLSLLLCALLSMSSCTDRDDDRQKSVFFPEEYLSELGIADLPAPDLSDCALDENTLYINFTDAEYESYARAVASYLGAKEDIYHFGVFHSRESFGLFIIPIPYDLYAPIDSDYSFSADSHSFAFAREEDLHLSSAFGKYGYKFPVEISLRRIAGEEKEKAGYDTKIVVREKSSIYLEENAYYKQLMIKTAQYLDPEVEYSDILYYYGRYGNCTVAMIDSAASGDAEWSEVIGDYEFRYPDGSGISAHLYDEAYYHDKIFSLAEAYEKGFIPDYALRDIHKAHLVYMSYLYEESN